MTDSVAGLAEQVAAIYAEAELALIRQVARRLARGLDAPGWAQARLAEVAGLRRDTVAIVAALARYGTQAVQDAVAAAWRAGHAAAAQDLTAAADRVAADREAAAVAALADAVLGELRPVHTAILPAVESVYRRAVAAAVGRRLATRLPMRQCAQAAWQGLADRGVVRYPATDGRMWRLHTYVEMAVRTALTRADTVATVAACEAAGGRLVYVTDRPGECGLCRPWEHKILALSGEVGRIAMQHHRRDRLVLVEVAGTLADAHAAGLQHPQCQHRIRPYLPGVTQIGRRNTEDPAGDAARQRLRHLERMVRHWREREAAALVDEVRAAAAGRAGGWLAELERHVEATGVPRLRYRERPGAGFTPPQSRTTDPVSISP